MTRDKIKEGDICTLDESVEYSYNPHKPYEVLVLWHGVNSQPLVTRLDEYKPFWTTYSQLTEVKRHIDLSFKALEQQACEDAVSREAVLGLFAQNTDAVRPYSKTWEEVKALPSVNPAEKQEPCEDVVSREAAIDAVNDVIADYVPNLFGRYEALPLEMASAINRLPPVNPQPKTIQKKGK